MPATTAITKVAAATKIVKATPASARISLFMAVLRSLKKREIPMIGSSLSFAQDAKNVRIRIFSAPSRRCSINGSAGRDILLQGLRFPQSFRDAHLHNVADGNDADDAVFFHHR